MTLTYGTLMAPLPVGPLSMTKLVALFAAVTASVAEPVAVPDGPTQRMLYVYVPAVDCDAEMVPLTGSVPAHAPEAAHEVAFVADHVNVEGCPMTTLAGVREMLTVGAGGATGALELGLELPPPPQAARLKISTKAARLASENRPRGRLIDVMNCPRN